MKFLLLFSFIFLVLFSFVQTVFPQVRLSEIMFDPVGSEYTDEFIEIYNRSLSDSINLSGWKIGDEKSLDAVTEAGSGLVLAPGQYGLILDPGYFTHSTAYDSRIPPGALILTITGNSFGSGGLSNSKPETVYLVNAAGDTVDAYRYTLDNPPGFSDEKINMNQNSNTNNWKNALILNGTPGYLNSVARRTQDVALIAADWDSLQVRNGGAFSPLFRIKNAGTVSASGMNLAVYEDKDFNEEFETSEIIFQKAVPETLSAEDSLALKINLGKLAPGLHRFKAVLNWASDENIRNNFLLFKVSVKFLPHSLLFSEIMYRPAAGSPEWVEIKNVSGAAVRLYRWYFSDENTNRAGEVFRDPVRLQPNGYVVLAQSEIPDAPDSLRSREIIVPNWPTLNNSGDEVWLFDPAGAPIAQTDYSIQPLTPAGFSLERMEFAIDQADSDAWGVSRIAGGTPGSPNSINPLFVDGVLDCAPENDPVKVYFKDSVIVNFLFKNEGRRKIGESRVKIYEDRNQNGAFEPEEQIQEESFCSETLNPGDSVNCSVYLDGLSSGKHSLSAFWEVREEQNPADNRVSFFVWRGFPESAVVLNEVMYDPRPGRPEWVELFNPGAEAVSLQDWLICDTRKALGKGAFRPPSFILPEDFKVLTRDSSFFTVYPDVDKDHVLVDKNFPTLNNSGDSLFLIDLSGATIDSLVYRSAWGGQNGRSLERIRSGNSTADSTNWSASVAESGCTPAAPNSILLHTEASGNWLTIAPDPFSPDGDGRDDFVTFTIQTKFPTAVAELKIFDSVGREIRRLLANQPVGSRYECIWDGRDVNGKILPMGIYIAYLEIYVNQRKQKSTKKVFVLAKRM